MSLNLCLCAQKSLAAHRDGSCECPHHVLVEKKEKQFQVDTHTEA